MRWCMQSCSSLLKPDEADYRIIATLGLPFACSFRQVFIIISPISTDDVSGPESRLKRQTCFAQFKKNICCCVSSPESEHSPCFLKQSPEQSLSCIQASSVTLIPHAGWIYWNRLQLDSISRQRPKHIYNRPSGRCVCLRRCLIVLDVVMWFNVCLIKPIFQTWMTF